MVHLVLEGFDVALNQAQRVQLECNYGIRAHKTLYGMVLGPNSIMALKLEPLGKGPCNCMVYIWAYAIVKIGERLRH